MNSLTVLVILSGGIQIISGEILKCEFKVQNYTFIGTLYSCEVTSLDNSNNNLIITGSTGVHMKNKINKDVKAIMVSNTKTKLIPTNLGTLFNLKALLMHGAQLFEIKSNNFEGIQELELLSLSNNKLSFLPTDVFKTLPKLKIISLSSNQFENLGNGLFDNNLNLERIYLYQNKIKFIGSGLFNRLLKLNFVNLKDNLCLNKEYRDSKEINLLKNDIKSNCINNEMEERIKNLVNELSGVKEELENYKIIHKSKTQELSTKLKECEANMSMLNGFNMICRFSVTNGAYSCVTQDLSIYRNNMELNKVIGTHLMSNTNADVTELFITNSSTSFWSNKIFKTFPALQSVYIRNAQMKELTKGDFSFASKLTFLEVYENDIRVLRNYVFEGAENLIKLEINSNQIVRVSTETFKGLKNVEKLSLKDNSITKLDLGTFKDVKKLNNLILTGNKIKFLDGKIFEFNLQLRVLAIDHNELREIGEEILSYSKIWKDVIFNGNDCIYEEFEGSEVEELKFNIKHCCKIPEMALNVYNCGNRGWIK